MAFRVTPYSSGLNLSTWLQGQLSAFEVYMRTQGIVVAALHVEPARPQEGLIVRADGTDWDPGSGAGFYGYNGGAWTFLG